MNDNPKYRVDARQSQIGVMGEHARVDEIHFHAPSAPQSLHQIPEPTATFKGRKKELDELTGAIRESSVTISGVRGMGGIGKTALALKLAQRLADNYPDAQLFIDLDGTSPSPMRPEQAMAHVIHAFHPRLELPSAESELSGLYRSVLRGKQVLLLLDDAAGAEQVKPLIPPRCCALLVTSRWRFRLAGMHALDLDVLDEEAALDLLCTIAPRIGNRAAEDIAELCGRLPLALELAASALAERVDLAPAEYARRLRDERARLDLVDASLSLSYDLLDDALQRLWARLAVFSIPFERQAAAAVWEMAEGPAHDRLGELLRYSVVDWREGIDRYQLHDLARVFAYAKLKERENPRPVHRLAAEYLRAKLTDEGNTPEEVLEEVDQWERAEAWEPFALRAHALRESLDCLGYWGEIQERLRRALAAIEEHFEEPSLEATLLSDLGIIAYKSAEWERAIRYYEKDLEISECVGDMHRVAQTFNNLGSVYLQKGEWDRAIKMCQRSLEIFERMDDVHRMAPTWTNLGSVYLQKGEWKRAIEMYQRSLEISECVGDVHETALTWNNLGSVYLQKGEWDEAIEMYQRSLEIDERVGNVHGMALTWNNLGSVYLQKGEWDRAIEIYDRSLETMKCVGDVHGMALTWGNLGSVYRKKGKWDQAIEMYQRSLKVFERVGDVRRIAQTFNNLGLVYAAKDERERAIKMYQRSLKVFERVGDVYGTAQTFNNLGLVYADKDEWKRAIEYYEKDLEISERVDDVYGMAQTLNNLGLVYADQGEWERAIKMYERSLEAKERVGDVHGMAQTWGNLGLVYADKGEWERAIEMYQKSLEVTEKLGDWLTSANQYRNLGILYLQTDRPDEAKPFLAHAYSIFAQLGSPHAQTAANALVRACGSVDAAKTYLANWRRSRRSRGFAEVECRG